MEYFGIITKIEKNHYMVTIEYGYLDGDREVLSEYYSLTKNDVNKMILSDSLGIRFYYNDKKVRRI